MPIEGWPGKHIKELDESILVLHWCWSKVNFGCHAELVGKQIEIFVSCAPCRGES